MLRFVGLIAFCVIAQSVSAQCKKELCNLSIRVLENPEFNAPIFTTSKALKIDKGVTLKQEDGGASIINFGATTEIGGLSLLKNIYVSGLLEVEPSARVSGSIYGKRQERSTFGVLKAPYNGVVLKPKELVTYINRTSADSIAVPNSNLAQVKLKPGNYTVLKLEPKKKLVVETGIYFFQSLELLAESELSINNKQGTVFIFVLDKFNSFGRFSFLGDEGNVFIGHFGRGEISIGGEFSASLVAPDAHVDLFPSSSAKGHRLTINARSLHVAEKTLATRLTRKNFGVAYETIMQGNRKIRSERAKNYGINQDIPNHSYIKQLPESPIKEQLLKTIEAYWSFAPNGRATYHEFIFSLRETPEATVKWMGDIYNAIPQDFTSADDRTDLVSVLRDLQLDEAAPLLLAIATRPVESVVSGGLGGHGYNPNSKEYGIRTIALNGLSLLASAGNAQAKEMLLNTVIQTSDEGVRHAAAVAFLTSGDTNARRVQLRNSLPNGLEYLADLNFNPELFPRKINQPTTK